MLWGFPTKAAMTAMNGRWAWEEFEAHTDASIWSEVKFIWTFSWLPWGSPANDLDKWKNSGNMGPYLKIWYLDTRLSLQDWRNRWRVSGHLISGFFQLAKKAFVDESKRWCLSSFRGFGTPLLASGGFKDEYLISLVDAHWLNHISLEARALEVLACHHRCGGWNWWPKSTWESGQSATEEVGMEGWMAGLDCMMHFLPCCLLKK